MAMYDKTKYVLLSFSITILLWASAFPVIKLALEDFKAENLSALRLVIGAFLLIIIGVIKQIKLPEKRDLPVILLLGFCGFTVYHTALSFGEHFVSAGIASLLVSTTPIFSAMLATLFLNHHFSKWAWFGSSVAFIGVAFISLSSKSELKAALLGIILVLVASFGESIYFVFQSRLLKKYGFLPLTIYTIISGAIFSVIFLPSACNDLFSASTSSVLSVLYLGIFPTVIPYIALAYTIQEIGVSDATLSLYLTPAVSLLLAYVLLGEIPNLIALTGGTITLIGVGIASKYSSS